MVSCTKVFFHLLKSTELFLSLEMDFYIEQVKPITSQKSYGIISSAGSSNAEIDDDFYYGISAFQFRYQIV